MEVKTNGEKLSSAQFHSLTLCTFDIFLSGLLCDLLWSDPDKDVQGWGENDRGVSFTFGADVVSKFLNRHDLDLICRAHQVTLYAPLCLKTPNFTVENSL